jgi:hypothetical protein
METGQVGAGGLSGKATAPSGNGANALPSTPHQSRFATGGVSLPAQVPPSGHAVQAWAGRHA